MLVDICAEAECYTPVIGKKHGIARKFYIGDAYCRHLQAEYGHRVALASDCLDDPPENLLDGWAD